MRVGDGDLAFSPVTSLLDPYSWPSLLSPAQEGWSAAMHLRPVNQSRHFLMATSTNLAQLTGAQNSTGSGDDVLTGSLTKKSDHLLKQPQKLVPLLMFVRNPDTKGLPTRFWPTVLGILLDTVYLEKLLMF